VESISCSIYLTTSARFTNGQVAACLGTNFDAKVIEKVKKDDDIDASFLQKAQDYGYLQKVSESEKYVWAHDQIQVSFGRSISIILIIKSDQS